MKTALAIGGSDSSGGAGIQADLKTFSVLGVYGMSAITAVTAQNTQGTKESLAIDAKLVAQQINVTASDIQVDATKTGLLPSVDIVQVVEDAIKRNNLQPYVCDPVLLARGEEQLVKSDALEAIKRKLFPLASVVTPDKRETAALIGGDANQISSVAAAKDAARRLAAQGARAVIIKAIEISDQMIDLFYDGKEFYELSGTTQPAEKTHGAGSAFSAAIAAGLANRMSLLDAIDQAKNLVNMAIQYSDGQGRGTAPINVLAFAPKKK
jgi:hydroxymethylpyrimidine/phosphomethylpyrimidine kinase